MTLSTSMATWIVAVLVKDTALLLGVWGVAWLLRRRSPALRHLIWCAGLLGVLALPLLSATVPWKVNVQTTVLGTEEAGAAVGTNAAAGRGGRAGEAEVGAAKPVAREWTGQQRSASAAPPAAPAAPAGSGMLDVADLLLALWLAGAALIVLRLLLGWAIVRRLVARAAPLETPEWTRPLWEAADRLGLATAPHLVMSARAPMPFAAGILHPTIVLPTECAEWTDRRRRAVLTHELAHLRRADLVVNALGQLACAAYWFHPLIWIAAKRLRMESERACDNLVLGFGTRASEYADHLLEIVCGAAHARAPALALPMAERREFEGRMLAILERDAERRTPSRMHAGAIAGLAALLVIPLASVVPTPRVTAVPPTRPADGAAHRAAAMQSHTDTGVNVQVTVDTRAATRSASQAISLAVRTALRTFGDTHAQPDDTSRDRAVSALVHALDDSVSDVRRGAAYALGALDAPSAVPALARVVTHDPSDTVREMAAWALGRLADEDAVPALGSAATTDASSMVRTTSVWALGRIADSAGAAPLAKALEDASPETRARAAWALGRIAAQPAPPALLGALEDTDPDVRMTAAWALGQIGDSSTATALGAAAQDKDPDVRRAVLWALGQLDSSASHDALVRFLKDPDPAVRSQAARALGGVGPSPWPWPWPWPRR